MLQNSSNIKEKQRHGCLTAYLVVLIGFSLAALGFYLLRAIGRNDSPVWESLIFAAVALFDVICLAAVFMWKKWGVWGLCSVQLIGFIVSIIQGELIIVSLINLVIGLGLLFWVLHIGGENKGWPQLE